jgi:endonuclease/exonuclease/phosphatase family metal-dependent hydrolase
VPVHIIEQYVTHVSIVPLLVTPSNAPAKAALSVQVPEQVSEQVPKEIRVLCWNILIDTTVPKMNGESTANGRLERIANVVRMQDPDIVLLQEVTPASLATLLSHLDDYHSSPLHIGCPYGQVILSRLGKFTCLFYSTDAKSKGKHKHIVLGQITVPGQPSLNVFNLHLSAGTRP